MYLRKSKENQKHIFLVLRKLTIILRSDGQKTVRKLRLISNAFNFVLSFNRNRTKMIAEKVGETLQRRWELSWSRKMVALWTDLCPP